MKTSLFRIPDNLKASSSTYPHPPVKGTCVFIHCLQRLWPIMATLTKRLPKPGALSVTPSMFSPSHLWHPFTRDERASNLAFLSGSPERELIFEVVVEQMHIACWWAPQSRILFCHGRTTPHELDSCKGLRSATTARQLNLPTRYSVRAAERNSARSPPAPDNFSLTTQIFSSQ